MTDGPMGKYFLPHVFNDDAECIYCDCDGADAHWQMWIHRCEVGDDEHKACIEAGDFDHYIYCHNRPIGYES